MLRKSEYHEAQAAEEGAAGKDNLYAKRRSAAERREDPGALRRPADVGPGGGVKGPSPAYPVRAIGIITPFENVAVHIKESQGIRQLTTARLRRLGFGDIVTFKPFPIIAERIRRRRARSAGVFTFRCAR